MDEKEVRRVVETYSDMILRISYNYLQHTFDAEDICQTVLLKFISCDLSFDTNEHEKAWMIRTTINACHDLRKNAYSRKTVGLDAVTGKESPKAPDSDLLEEIKKLPVNYRMSIYLYYYEGYTSKEISEMLKKPCSTIRNHLCEARNLLKERLGDDYYEE